MGNSVLTQNTSKPCTSCITADGDTQYLANCEQPLFPRKIMNRTDLDNTDLTALDAGCLQKPAPGHILGLNGSVISPFAIGIIDPALLTPVATTNSRSTGLSSTSIAAIITVVVVVLLVIAAVVFIRIKKRQNRRKRASYAAKYKAWGGSSSSHMPQSPLSFQCRTQMGPASPKFFHDNNDDNNEADPSTNSLYRKPSSQKPPRRAIAPFQPISAVTESSQEKPQPRRESSRSSHQNPLRYHPANHQAVALHSLNTNPTPAVVIPPSYPTPTHASPLSGSQARFSPDSTTPTSAASTRSTAPLLPYVPAHHAAVPSLQGGAGQQHSVAASPGASSSPSSMAPPPPMSPRMLIGVAVDGVEGLVKFRAAPHNAGMKKRESGSPVESRKVMSVFPPPPPRRR